MSVLPLHVARGSAANKSPRHRCIAIFLVVLGALGLISASAICSYVPMNHSTHEPFCGTFAVPTRGLGSVNSQGIVMGLSI